VTTARRVLAHPSSLYISFILMVAALSALLYLAPPAVFIAILIIPILTFLVLSRNTLIPLLIFYRSGIGALFALGGIACMGFSAYHFRPQPESLLHYRPTPQPEAYYDASAVYYLLAGLLLLLFALIFSARSLPFRRPTARHLVPHVRRWHGWLETVILSVGLLLLLAFAESNGGLIGLEKLEQLPPHEQFALMLGALLCLTLGLGGIPRFSLGVVRANWRELALVLGITMFALIIRFWKLGDAVRMMIDEGHFALGIGYLQKYPNIRLLEPMPTAASFPFIFSYFQAQAVEIFGRNFLGMRAASALIGTLTIPALYLLARYLFDRTTALMAALLLAAFPPHIHFSRLGLNNIADPLFGTLALGFLARAFHTGRRMDYTLAGIALGLTQYFYEGGRLLYPGLVVGWLLMGFVFWRPRPSLRGSLLLLLAFVLVAMPVYYTLQGTDFPLLDRMDKTRLDDGYLNRTQKTERVDAYVTHFKHSLMMYVNSPENTYIFYYLYYGGREPLILSYIVPFFLLGVAITLWRWHTPGFITFPWLIGTSLGNAVLIESAVTPRYVVVFPALALLIAVGIRYTLPLIWPQIVPIRWLTARTKTLFLAGLVALLVADQIAFYFGPFLDLFNSEARANSTADVDDALLRSVDFPAATQIHIVADQTLPQLDAQRLMNFLADDLNVLIHTKLDFQAADLNLLPRSVDQAFFLLPDDEISLVKLRVAFPLLQGPYYTTYDVPDGKALVLYYVPAEDHPGAVG